MLSSHRRRQDRGQAIIELAIIAPILAVLIFAGVDIGTNYVTGTSVSEAAHAGILAVVQQNTDSNLDLGLVIRHASTDLQQADWGAVGPYIAAGADYNCNLNDVRSTRCGDPNGCDTSPASPFWSIGSPTACFAVGTCGVEGTSQPSQCAGPLKWNPGGGAPQKGPPNNLSFPSVLVVRVVVRQPADLITGPFLTGPYLTVENYAFGWPDP